MFKVFNIEIYRNFWGLLFRITLSVGISLLVTLTPSLWADSLETLEGKVFTEYDDSLSSLETELVHKIQNDPNSVYAYYLLSYVYLRIYTSDPLKNNYGQKALDLAQQALELDRSSEFGYLALCDAYQALGFYEKSAGILKQAPSPSWRSLYRMIKFQIASFSPIESIHLLKAATIKHLESRNVLVPLILSLTKNLHGSHLHKTLLDLDKKIHHPLIKQDLAILYLADKQPKRSQLIFEEMMKTSIQSYPEIAFNYGVLLKHKFHKNNYALNILNRALNLPNFPSPLKPSIYIQLSSIYLERKDDSRFIQAMLKAIESSNEQQVEVLEGLALDILEKRADRFSTYMNLVLSHFPGHPEFYAIIGKIYADQLNIQGKAIEYYTNASILDPNNSFYMDAVGVSYFRIGDLNKAIMYFDYALMLDPNDSIAFYNKACVLSRQGMETLALTSLKHAIDINPSLQEEALNDTDFERLRDLPSFKRLMTISN
jgi:tetratricopeptide (TPR) repeat protein